MCRYYVTYDHFLLKPSSLCKYWTHEVYEISLNKYQTLVQTNYNIVSFCKSNSMSVCLSICLNQRISLIWGKIHHEKLPIEKMYTSKIFSSYFYLKVTKIEKGGMGFLTPFPCIRCPYRPVGPRGVAAIRITCTYNECITRPSKKVFFSDNDFFTACNLTYLHSTVHLYTYNFLSKAFL